MKKCKKEFTVEAQGAIDSMSSVSKSHKWILLSLIYSTITLVFHMAALKLLYSAIDLLLYANELVMGVEKNRLSEQIENLKQYSLYCSNVFMIMCYISPFLFGVLLILKKIGILSYFKKNIFFWIIQILGISIFIQIFNVYGMSENFGRINLILHQKLIFVLVLLPVIIFGVVKIFPKDLLKVR